MISEVLITCDEDNARSRRVSESNNGQLQDVQNGSVGTGSQLYE